ncbi:trypsin-like serine protease [Mitsuaria sp. GD03876]|uniref:trypsin-like serine protease n=1 Tax=Mitsuaria sp. GD03876 TaxID=2975399 RepID=UPI0024470237|nr:trypsin-like serine protease [Mitsuaria sp. GD03876]MDH0863011.1 trypsin-like serine protease [Mitsuaria sp. GD03876]
MKFRPTILAAALLAAGAAHAGPATVSGSANGLNWTASSSIVGVTSTATGVGGGDPRYNAPRSQYSGVATLIMDYGAGGQFICSGTLLPNQRSILTAAHCVSDGTNARPLSTSVYFYTGSDPDNVTWNQPTFSYTVTNYAVHTAYTGDVIDQNDIAVLSLDRLVDWSVKSHELYDGGDLTGQNFNIAGYGGRSDTGGDVGANLGTGRLRQGDNRYDFRLGDPDFDGAWADILEEPAEQIEHTYLSDFDNGLAVNDLSCNIATLGLGLPPSAKFCDRGRGASEVSSAGGDSGGPEFINGKVASVTSFGLTFGSDWGDVDDDLNSSFGEFNGFVPVSIHRAFIEANAVPEPASFALAGLGLLGLGWSRRRRAQS